MKNNLEAKVLCMISIGAIKLNAGLLDDVKVRCLSISLSYLVSSQVIIEQAGKELDTVGGVTEVHGRYYNLSSEYHKVCVVLSLDCVSHWWFDR